MRIITLSIIFTLIAITSFAADSQFKSEFDKTVALSQQSSLETGLPNSNYVALTEKNATRHFAKTITLYNYLAAKSVKNGSLKTAEKTLISGSIPLSLRYGTDQSDYTCFMALAGVYVNQKKYSQAKWYYIQSNTSAKKGNNNKGQVLSLIQLAQVKRAIGDNTLAIQDLKQAEKIAVKYKFKTSLPEIRSNIKAYSKKEAAKTIASVKKTEAIESE
jgi:hypothetical protein